MAYVNDNHINSHLDRLEYNEYRERHSLFADMWPPVAMGAAGFILFITANLSYKKPAYTALWRAGIIVPACAAAGVWLRDNMREKSRVKWAKIRHYIELHPEDFPKYPRRVKVGETLSTWIPRRAGW